MRIGFFLEFVRESEQALADAFYDVAAHHVFDMEVQTMSNRLAKWSEAHARAVQPYLDTYGAEDANGAARLRSALFHGPRVGGLGLLRDLQDVYLLATEVRVTWHMLNQAAKTLHDKQFQDFCVIMGRETERQLDWLYTQLSVGASQALIAAEK